ncbi:MAG TPA: SBBP repeat-containing protein, partial [Pyrinomonadaceae bacterium]|nr:SBBP repeat-containing protein [Pyrinomonadaceae bacterium]
MQKTPNQIFRRFFTVLALCGTMLLNFQFNFSVRTVSAETITENQISNTRTAVSFEENRGQFDKQVRYFARSGGANVFLTATEAIYVLPLENTEQRTADNGQKAFALRMKIVGANAESTFTGEHLREQRTNYFKGTAEDWRTDIPNFGVVHYENVYNGINMVWHGLESGATRYDFVVAPNVDAEQIVLEFDGADNLEIGADGNLLIHTPAGIIKQNKPFSFQETDGAKQEIESRFIIEQSKIKFQIGDYDRSKPLVIDPTVSLNNLAFSTFLGSFGDDISNDIAVDASGNTYITGRTLSPAYPTTAGTFDTSANGQEDVFVTKINASGTNVVFSTFLGGTFYDEGNGIVVDPVGNIYIAGAASAAFPTTSGAFDTTFNGGADVFITKLNPNGSNLLYSTYIGSASIDFANDLAIDGGGNAYIVVRTSDAVIDYPTTAGTFDETFNGFDDVAVTKLNDTGTVLVYSTFLGGGSIDNGTSIAVSSNGEAIIGGATTDDAVNFPTTAGAFDTTHNGATDFFITRLNAGGSALVYSTLIGGAGIDNAS